MTVSSVGAEPVRGSVGAGVTALGVSVTVEQCAVVARAGRRLVAHRLLRRADWPSASRWAAACAGCAAAMAGVGEAVVVEAAREPTPSASADTRVRLAAAADVVAAVVEAVERTPSVRVVVVEPQQRSNTPAPRRIRNSQPLRKAWRLAGEVTR